MDAPSTAPPHRPGARRRLSLQYELPHRPDTCPGRAPGALVRTQSVNTLEGHLHGRRQGWGPDHAGHASDRLGQQQRDGLRGSQESRIGDQPALQVIGDPAWCRSKFDPRLAARYGEYVRLTGETPAGSAAHSILTTIRAITTPTPFEHWFGAGCSPTAAPTKSPGALSSGSRFPPRMGNHGRSPKDTISTRTLVNGSPRMWPSWSMRPPQFLTCWARRETGWTVHTFGESAD